MAWWPDSPRHPASRAGHAGADVGLVGTEPWVFAGVGGHSPGGGRGGHTSGLFMYLSRPTEVPSSLLHFYFHHSTYHQ